MQSNPNGLCQGLRHAHELVHVALFLPTAPARPILSMSFAEDHLRGLDRLDGPSGHRRLSQPLRAPHNPPCHSSVSGDLELLQLLQLVAAVIADPAPEEGAPQLASVVRVAMNKE